MLSLTKLTPNSLKSKFNTRKPLARLLKPENILQHASSNEAGYDKENENFGKITTASSEYAISQLWQNFKHEIKDSQKLSKYHASNQI